jgi:hypothetical protein
VSCPELSLAPRTTPAASPSDAAPPESASEALAAIASTYEDARAGIISGDNSGAVSGGASPHPLAAGHSPTVPLILKSSRKRAEPPQGPPTGAREAMTALWSRVVRRGTPARRGRHSATESDSFSGGSLPWGSPGRVRFLS